MDAEIAYLIRGYQRFRDHYFDGTNTLFESLVKEGQKPRFLILACSDSRVDPALVMHCRPGDLFVIRNVANLAPPYEKNAAGYHGTSAALEFGVCELKIKHIILFGHTQCGGIKALLENKKTGKNKGFITKWMDLASNARTETLAHTELSPEQKINLCAQYSLKNSLNKLRSFPWITEKVDKGKLFLHAWYFDLEEGLIHAFDHEEKQFIELSHAFAP